MKCIDTPFAHADATIAQQFANPASAELIHRECSLVQIYPTRIVDGLIRIDSDSFTLGRDECNDLPLPDGSVSRFHAVLQRTENGYRVRDLGSTNGTYVNNDRITEVALQGGEILRIGSFLLKFLESSSIETQYHSTVYDALTRDGLTGAFNKRYLIDSLEREIARAVRRTHPLSILIMDIDHFKKINDSHGHLIGDQILREFSRRILNSKRSDDLFCRYGGEEFVIILTETCMDEAATLAERFRDFIASSPFASDAGDIHVTVSIGATQLDARDMPSVEGILKQADDLLYRAKQTGRNRVCCASTDPRLSDKPSESNDCT